MVECIQIQGVTAVPTDIVLPEKVASVAVHGVACLRQQPIVSPSPQWGTYRPAYGVVVPAIVVRRGMAQVRRHPVSIRTAPMSAQTRHFIQHVFVPILQARYLAESKSVAGDVK
jgi:hypothetical protein